MNRVSLVSLFFGPVSGAIIYVERTYHLEQGWCFVSGIAIGALFVLSVLYLKLGST